MKTEELLLLAAVGVGVYFLAIRKTPSSASIPAPSTAPAGAYNSAYGFPTNTLNGAAYANGGYQQRSTAQDVATYIGAIAGAAQTASNIAQAWT